jgi:hypothetical protein
LLRNRPPDLPAAASNPPPRINLSIHPHNSAPRGASCVWRPVRVHTGSLGSHREQVITEPASDPKKPKCKSCKERSPKTKASPRAGSADQTPRQMVTVGAARTYAKRTGRRRKDEATELPMQVQKASSGNQAGPSGVPADKPYPPQEQLGPG